MNALPIPARDPNSTPNPLFVKVLKTGLRKLWMARYRSRGCGKKHEFICNAVNNIELQKVIGKRLGLASESGFMRRTYGGWIRNMLNTGYIPLRELQAGRKAWMLDLIEEFS